MGRGARLLSAEGGRGRRARSAPTTALHRWGSETGRGDAGEGRARLAPEPASGCASPAPAAPLRARAPGESRASPTLGSAGYGPP